MKHAEQNQSLVNVMRDRTMTPSDRGDHLIFNVCENGIDFRPAIQQLIADADLGQELKKKYESAGKNPLVLERYLCTFKQPTGATYAMITSGRGRICLPVASDEVVKDLKVGEMLLVDMEEKTIVGRDGMAPVSGDIVPVESRPAEKPGHVIIRHHDREELVPMHNDLIEHPEACEPGKQVVYDPVRQFAVAGIDSHSDGEELLCDPATIASVRRQDVGSPRAVVDEILDRVRQFIDHPDWIETMQCRDRASYLFAGGTGSGKSFHLKLIANEVHDMVEEYTGQRTSRLVIVDASQFWTPYFGETEQRISKWAEKLQKLGSRKLRSQDGRELQIPLIVALEECEALLRSRGESQGSGHLFDRPLALLLQKTESLESALQVPIIWIATSNRADLADAAALRRLGMRQVVFGSLEAHETLSVLTKKVPEGMKIRGAGRDSSAAREALLRKVVGYLYGPEPKQGIAEVRLGNSERRTLNRSDVVTPAVIEESISSAVDRCLRESNKAGRLLGLDADDVIAFLHRHFVNLARTLRPYNLAEHAADWYEQERIQVSDVIPLVDLMRRPASLMVS